MNKMKKLLSSLLALSMVLSYVPMSAVAEEVCTHHVHDDKCGYVQAVEGKSCTHQCTESCPKKDVTVCVHDHVKLGCAHTPAVEGVACDHVHGEACGYVPAQAAVPCTCGAVAAHTAQCASLVTEGAECDCGMPTLHAEGCEPKAAVAEQCSHVHGACAYKAAVQESWGCGHVCTKDSGCVKAVCAHAHDASCGYVQAVKGSDCTFVCTECKAEEKTCTCGAAEEGEDEHAPFCDLYERTYEECKCVLDCAVEGLNDYCETCYFEGVEACGASGEEEASAYLTEGTDYTITNDELVIRDGVTKIDDYAFRGKSITSVVIPASVTTIGNYAFYYCYKLTAVTIAGNSSLTIGNYAFHGCSSLPSVTYQSTSAPASIGDKAFPTTVQFVTVPYGFTAKNFGGLSLNIVGGGPVAVESVTLKRDGNDAGSRVSMTCKAPMQLTADISPTNADNKKVTWTQKEQYDAKPFLTIANDGTITATFAGYTAADFEPFVYGYYSDVTVTTEDGSKTDTVTVEVNRYILVIKDGETERFRLPRPAGYALSGLIPAEYTTPSKPGYIFKGWKRAYEQADGTMGYERLIKSLPATMPHTSASNAAHEQIYVEQWEVDPDATFAVNVSNTTGGTVTANHSAAAAETVITLTVNVSNGYELEGFTDGTNAITTTKVDDTTYTFVMPNRDVTVTPVYKSLHQHQWAYSVNAAKDTITATCTADGCPNTDGGSVTISASDATYDGTANTATAKETNWIADNITVLYQKQTGTDTWDTATDIAPINAGTYQASITLGSAKISAIYTVSPKTVQITGVTAESRPYQANNKTVKVAVVNTDADSVTVTVPDGYTGTLSSDAVGNYNAITLDLTNLTLSNPNYQLPQSGENLTTNVSITGTIAETDVAGIEVSYAYTGEVIQPTPIVTVNGVELVKNTDYTVTYGANTNVADGGTVKITGKNLYSGEVEKTFTITPLEIKEEHIVLTPADAVYDGNVKSTEVTVVMDGERVDPQNYEVTGLVAIGSAIGEYPITITGKGNYTGTVTKNFEITAKQLSEAGVTLTADLTYHGEAQEPAITVKDGNTELSRTSDYTVSYEKVNENSSATPIQGAPVDAGSYNAVITGKGSYGGEIRKSFEIKPNTSIDVTPTELDDEVYTGEEIEPAVQITGVKLIALEKDKDYTIVYENNTNAGEAKITITGIGNYAGAKKELTFTITAKALTEANVTIGETILGYEEGKTTVPEITVKDGSKTLTAGTDYVVTYLDKDGQKVDAPSAVGIYTVQVIGIADLSEDGSGNYSGTVSKTFVITDDVTAPEITGVANGKTYYTTQKVTARDENLVSVTKNGTAITPVVATGTEVALEGNQTATYTVAAADIAENESAITITMKPISSLDDTIENLTTENVKLSDKDAIEDVLNAVKPIRERECGNATQTEKNALDAIISKCDDLLKVITDVEDAISKIQALPNPTETAPDNETAVIAYDAAKKAYDALSEHGKELVGAENKAKLDAMLKALTAYDVIKGHKSSYTRGSGKTFSLTANGYFGKFTGLKIDGKILDSKYYTAKSGSTIVTLKNSYLDSLSDGKHTVEFLYTDGSTGGDHYFRISTNNGSPFTGDNNHIMMFSGIMMTSLLCMAMMIMFVPRKKGKYQR